MTNGASAGSGPPASHASGPSAGTIPRRQSYASVASGAAAQTYPTPTRSRDFSHLANSTPSSSYPPQYQSDPRRARTYSGQEELNANGSVPFGSTWRKSAPLPVYSRQYANLPGYGYPVSMPPSSFFVPSYLRNSRYVSELEAAHKAKLQAQRETNSGRSKSSDSAIASSLPPTPLSTSGSNTNGPRLAPSHRGATYDIIESNPPRDHDLLMPLPSKLSDVDKYPGMDLSNDGSEVRYNGVTTKSEMEGAMVRADMPIPPQCGIYYFEVEIKSQTKDGMIAVGFATQKASLERLPGWEAESWAYHGDDGKTFCGENAPKSYGHPFTQGDVVGCGINFHSGQAFFTKNGNDLGIAFRELKNVRPFPAIGMKKHAGAMASINFGQRPFVFDIDHVMRKQQNAIQQEITKSSIVAKGFIWSLGGVDESELLQELVANYLAHDGYVETAKAFRGEVRNARRALDATDDNPMEIMEVEDDIEAVNRQSIRAAILDGDMEKAIQYTRKYFPEAIDETGSAKNENDILFKLKCRKWIELIRRSNELTKPTHQRNSRAYSTTSNGYGSYRMSKETRNTGVDDVFDQDMELDDDEPLVTASKQHHPGRADGFSSLDEIQSTEAEQQESTQLLREAIEYGTELMRDYGGKTQDSPQLRKLNTIFSLIAYDDAKSSVHGHLLDPAGRVLVAEELNSSILVSLGRPSSAAVEKLCKQTEALINELSQDGGAAAFVNLQEPRAT